jgi:hypothetical protein
VIRVGVAVMAHRKREAFIPELLASLDRPAEVVWDQRDDRWDTGRRSMLAHRNDPEATHWLVVQDDAIVCRDLVAGIESALAHVPSRTPLCLYVGKLTPFAPMVTALAAQATQDGVSWLSMDSMHWGVGIVMPVELIGPMVQWGDTGGQSIPNYDKRISRWLGGQGVQTFYPWPSLVDHRDSPSLVPGRGRRGRHAHRFLGADVSALDVDWSGGAIHVNALRSYSGGRRRSPASKERRPMAPTPVHYVSGDVFVAKQNGRVNLDGRPMRIIRGSTFAHASSWIVKNRPQLWRPVRLDFPPSDNGVAASTLDVEAMAQANPNIGPVIDPEALATEVVASAVAVATAPDVEPAPKPAAKDVRAWAKETGVDVPASGPIPAAVVEQYQAAHAVTEW